MSLKVLGYFNNTSNQLSKYEFVKLAYLELISNCNRYEQFLYSGYIGSQLNIVEKLTKTHVIKSFEYKYNNPELFRETFSLFNKDSGYHNDDTFNVLKKHINIKTFKNPENARFFCFLLFDFDIKQLNLKNISNNSSVAKFFDVMKTIQLNPSESLLKYRFQDIKNDRFLVDLENKFQKIYIHFKKMFSAYIVNTYVLFSALKAQSKKNLISSTYTDIIQESINNVSNFNWLSNSQKDFYLANLDLYNIPSILDICKNKKCTLLRDFTTMLFKKNNFYKFKFLGFKKHINEHDLLNKYDLKINFSTLFYNQFAEIIK